jgi:hypothetical protein
VPARSRLSVNHMNNMGIDIYARWEGQLPDQVEKQLEVWLSGVDGGAGYLREAYHGEPYATECLVPEAFEAPNGVQIYAAVLRERLPETLRLAEERERTVYGATTAEEIEPTLQSYRDFVALCERVERESGVPVTVVASW